MRGCVPWGGFGANPFPGALKRQFSATSELCSGGILYSEGIFDDINKILSAELFRDTGADPDAILTEYCGYYFGQTCTKELIEVIGMLEKTLYRARYSADGTRCDYPTGEQTELPVFVLEDPSGVEEIKNRIEAIDRRMPERVRESFRYRILYLRAVGDYELYKNGGRPNEKTDGIFSALNGIYHSENAHYFLAPLTRNSCLENKGHI